MSELLSVISDHKCGGGPCKGLPCCYAPADKYMIQFEAPLKKMGYSPKKYIHDGEVIGIFSGPDTEQKIAVVYQNIFGQLVPDRIGLRLSDMQVIFPEISEHMGAINTEMNVRGLYEAEAEQFPDKEHEDMQPYTMFEIPERMPVGRAKGAIEFLADKNLLRQLHYKD